MLTATRTVCEEDAVRDRTGESEGFRGVQRGRNAQAPHERKVWTYP